MEFEGIVIKTTPFRNQDAMVSILSQDKIYSVLARGVLKIDSKNAHRVAPFTLSRFNVMKTKDGYSLKNGELVNSFQNIKSKIECLAIIDFISETLNKIIVPDDSKKMFAYLKRALELLDSGFDPWTILLIYLAKLLTVSGFPLNVNSCQICHQRSQIVGVSYRGGGFICENCFDAFNHVKYTQIELKILRYLFLVEENDFDRVAFEKKECYRIFTDLCTFLTGVTQSDYKSVNLITELLSK